MIDLNLLSSAKKQQVKHQLLLGVLEYFISLMLIFISLIGTSLLTTKLIMQNSFNRAVNQNALITKEYGSLNQQVRIINEKIELFKKIQRGYNPWSSNVAALSELAPLGITLSSISINTQSKEFLISGRADLRETLLLYKNYLENLDKVGSTNIPIDSLLQSQNINFKLDGNLK